MKFPGDYRDQNFCNYNMMPKDQDYVKSLYKKTISIIHIEKILFFLLKKNQLDVMYNFDIPYLK